MPFILLILAKLVMLMWFIALTTLPAQITPSIPPEYFGAHTVGAGGVRLGVRKLHEDSTDWSQ